MELSDILQSKINEYDVDKQEVIKNYISTMKALVEHLSNYDHYVVNGVTKDGKNYMPTPTTKSPTLNAFLEAEKAYSDAGFKLNIYSRLKGALEKDSRLVKLITEGELDPKKMPAGRRAWSYYNDYARG